MNLNVLGMDSLMAIEIQQVLERDFGINITAPELRALSFEKLQKLTDLISIGDTCKLKKTETARKILFRALGDEKNADDILIPINMADTKQPSDTLAVFISGIEGVISPVLYTLCKNIEIPVYGLQYQAHCRVETFLELVRMVRKVIAQCLFAYLVK